MLLTNFAAINLMCYVILEDVYDDAIKELKKAGGYMTTVDEKESIKKTLWVDGHLNRKVIAKDPDIFAKEAGLSPEAFEAKFFMVEDENPGNDTPFCDEKHFLAECAIHEGGTHQ